jgi:diguanylate cyclase (GGDEF)-like protein/PAS domain S-box-containing protein
MVIMVLAMGLEGATVSGVVLTIVGGTTTSLHHGPLWLAADVSPEHRMLLLQLFLLVSAATALPVGALLDERRREGRAAEEARSIYQTLLQNAEDTIILSSFDGTRRYISPAIKALTGWTPAEFLAMDRMQTFHPDDRDMARLVMESMASGKRQHVVRYRIAQKDGGYRWVEAVARAYFDDTSGSVLGYVGTLRDISSLKQTEEIWEMERETLTREKLAMARLANTDALTVLPNRRAFDDALLRQLSRAAAVSVMMIDVDFFKAYNDLYGHQAGDDCLRQIAQALQNKVGRGGDVVARLGGEEFGVLLPGVDAGGARSVAESMLNAIWDLDIPHQSSPIGRITISIGIANWADIREHDTALLIQQADRALYVSKRAGKNRVTIAGGMPVAV